jgi:hypothetical protein
MSAPPPLPPPPQMPRPYPTAPRPPRYLPWPRQSVIVPGTGTPPATP